MSPAQRHIAISGSGKTPMKKSSVARTCNQLSLFLKENGCLRDRINAKFEDTVKSPAARMTLDLLSNIDNLDPNTPQTEKPVSRNPEDSVNQGTCSKSIASSESKTSQMTIFYDGQVMVLDEIPEDRARDVMLAARSYGVCESKQPIHVPIQANGLDLPIARRASLHKFLAKRKDRSTVRAPYQEHNPSPAAGSSNDEHEFDLNL